MVSGDALNLTIFSSEDPFSIRTWKTVSPDYKQIKDYFNPINSMQRYPQDFQKYF